MRIGSIGYECHSGLGHLMRDFYQHGVVNRVLIIPHPHYPHTMGWYRPEDRFIKERGHQFLSGLNVLLLFENAFHWPVVADAKRRGVKIVLIPNYEYTPFPPPVEPDLILCGSLLDVDYYSPCWPTDMLVMPVDTDRFPWRLRARAETFVHNAGHGQRGWAKGTPQLVEALQYVQSPIRLILRGQPGEKRVKVLWETLHGNPKIDLRFGDFPDEELYREGDIFINAEQYNGMSLPLQEAFASGMTVMTTDRYPANTWLPTEPLLPVDEVVEDRQAVVFERSIVYPKTIAAKIDEWYGTDVTEYSLCGREWAEAHSWTVMKPKYLDLLERLI